MSKPLKESKRPVQRHFGVIICLSLAIFWAWTSYVDHHPAVAEKRPAVLAVQSLPPRSDNPSPEIAVVAAGDDRDEELRQKAIGTWEDDYHGKRTMDLRADGTATMIVEPEGLGAALFAKKLTFDIQWKIEQGVMILKTLGGTPAKKIALVSKIYGDQAEEIIIELTDDRFLVEHDESTDFDWRRVSD